MEPGSDQAREGRFVDLVIQSPAVEEEWPRTGRAVVGRTAVDEGGPSMSANLHCASTELGDHVLVAPPTLAVRSASRLA